MTLKYFDMAELALAAYATLNRGPTVNQVSMLGKAGFAGAQAQSFLDRFPTVVAQYNDTSAKGGLGTGFSVTVFKDASSTGNLTVAIRGTEQLTEEVNGVSVDLFRWPRILPMYPELMKAS